MSVYQDQVFDFQDVRKSLKLIGKAYQNRSVAMIELSRLFLELSCGSWDQVFALKSLVDTIDNAVERAVDAGKDKNTDADNAFAVAEEELNRYAQSYHRGYEAVIGDTQNIIRLAAKEDNDLMKTRLGGLLPQSSRVVVSPGNSSQVRRRFQILTSPTDRVNSQTLVFDIGTEVKITEVLWVFARLPLPPMALGDNPYLYPSLGLPTRLLAYTEAFKLEPLKDLRSDNDSHVFILRDHPRTGRIVFECGTFCRTYTNIWKPHDVVILKDFQGTIEAASHINPEIQGEVRIWKRGTTHTPLELTDWTEVLDQALHYPHVDWLIRTETSPSEAVRIKYSWDPVPLQGEAPLSSDPLASQSSFQTMSYSPDSAAASNVVQSPSTTREKDRPECQRQIITAVPPLASVGSSQGRDPPDVPHTKVTDAPEVRYPLRKPRRDSKVTDSPGNDPDPQPAAATSRPPLEGTHPRFSTAPPLSMQIASPLDRLALSIEESISSTDETSTPNGNEMLIPWSELERCLSQANNAIDPLPVLAAAGRDSAARQSSS